MATAPVPVPTPWQPTSYGGNPYSAPGTTGQVLGANDVPNKSIVGGYTGYASGAVVPASNVNSSPQYTNNPVYPYQNTANVGSTPTTSNPAPQNNNNNPAPQNNGNKVISEGDALRLGLDWNNLPGGYSKAVSGGGPSQEDLMKEIDAAYNPQYDYLNQAENNLRGDYPNILSELESQYGTNKSILDSNRDTSLNQTKLSLDQGTNRKEDAMSAARRLFQELGQARIARFGGASSAGQAASELQGREFQSQQGQTNRQYNDFSQQIAMKNQEIEDNHKNALMQLEQTKQASINQATRDFQNKLLEIANNRTQIGAAKAQARLGALQDLRNQVFSINQQNAQFQQNLEMMKQQAMLNNQSYASQTGQSVLGAQGAVNSFSQNTTTTPTSQYGITGQQTGTSTPGLVGQIKRPEDQYVGQITPTKNPLDQYLPLNQYFQSPTFN